MTLNKFLISANAGPSQLAGKGCHQNFFSTSWQNDQTPMALGEVLNRRGVKSLYVMLPNYAAGKNMLAGVERTFRGRVVGRDMTKWGAIGNWISPRNWRKPRPRARTACSFFIRAAPAARSSSNTSRPG